MFSLVQVKVIGSRYSQLSHWLLLVLQGSAALRCHVFNMHVSPAAFSGPVGLHPFRLEAPLKHFRI